RCDAPRLAPGHRAARNDRYEVTLVRLALLVMRQQLRGAANELAVGLVLDQPHDFHGDRLLHLGADNTPRQGALASRLHLRGFGSFLFFTHDFLPPVAAPAAFFSASRWIVFARAILRRATPNWSGLGLWPVARCMRNANCSRRSLISSSPTSAADLPRSFSRYCLISPSFISEPAV